MKLIIIQLPFNELYFLLWNHRVQRNSMSHDYNISLLNHYSGLISTKIKKGHKLHI